MTWQNRIVRSEEVDPRTIPDHPHNWRTHPEAQAEALEGVLDDVGLVARCIVNLRNDPAFEAEQGTPVLLDGHLRKARAIARDQETVPVDYVDLDPREEALILSTLDPLAAMAQADPAILDVVLRQVETDSGAVRSMLAEVAKQAQLYEAGTEDDKYTRKIEAPLYEPTGPKPEVNELYDDTRTKQLVAEILEAPGLTEDERRLLIVAAQRHTVLRFDRIAEFYAHSGETVQRLMENSAMVIIDFDRAIELGFVRMTKKIANLVGEDYEDG